MSKNKVIGYLQSIIAIPMLAIGIPLSGINPTIDLNNIPFQITKENSVIITQEEVVRKEKAEKIDSYFANKDAPLAGYGMKFVLEAEKNNLDWRLLPAIAMRETTGGKHMCKNPNASNNAFGWGSCKIGFISIDQSIEHIAKSISGNNPNVKAYKVGMTSGEILKKYNPDSIIPGYSLQVIKIMNSINETVEIE